MLDRLVPRLLADVDSELARKLKFLTPQRRQDPQRIKAWLEVIAGLTLGMDGRIMHVRNRWFGTRRAPAPSTPDRSNRDFHWWQLASAGLPQPVLMQVYEWIGAAVGVALGAVLGPFLPTDQSPLWLNTVGSAFLFGFVGFLVGMAVGAFRRRAPFAQAPLYLDLRARGQVGRLVLFMVGGLICGAVFCAGLGGLIGLLLGAASEIFTGSTPAWIFFGVDGAIVGLAAGCAVAVDNPLPGGPAATPTASWRGARAASLVRLTVFTLAGVALAAWSSRASDRPDALVGSLIWLGFGGTLFAVFTSSRAWTLAIATIVYLARRRELPWRLMAFLDDAERLGLLRTVGAAYQFRHAEFHLHLARAHVARLASENQRLKQLLEQLESQPPPGRWQAWVNENVGFVNGGLAGVVLGSAVSLLIADTTTDAVGSAVIGGLALVGLAMRLLWRRRTPARSKAAGSAPPPANPPPP
jgi:hypothetical protein